MGATADSTSLPSLRQVELGRNLYVSTDTSTLPSVTCDRTGDPRLRHEHHEFTPEPANAARVRSAGRLFPHADCEPPTPGDSSMVVPLDASPQARTRTREAFGPLKSMVPGSSPARPR
jgi:hypothetical protein